MYGAPGIVPQRPGLCVCVFMENNYDLWCSNILYASVSLRPFVVVSLELCFFVFFVVDVVVVAGCVVFFNSVFLFLFMVLFMFQSVF